MSETTDHRLSGAAETLLLTLYLRALETKRPDALIRDDKAVAMVTKRRYDFGRFKLLHMSEANKPVIFLRDRQFDRYARDILWCHSQAVVVHIGCGLDTGFAGAHGGGRTARAARLT
jgi:O-methyltransferase involved in polyketide biosynthesis